MTGVPLVERYGPWALVAGAGAGLGEAYARQLADAGCDLVLVDRDHDAVAALADDLEVDVRPLVVDLGADAAADQVLSATADLDIGLAVLNAAASHVGPFGDQSIDVIDTQIRVNVRTPTLLVHGLLPRWRDRERSGLILMSSQSSRRGAPLVATYAGTKAYLAILAESLWDELGPDGVDVLGVLPGSTRTPGWLSSLPQSGLGTSSLMEPAEVVAEALSTLGSGVPTLVAGAANRDSEAFLDAMPRAEAVRMVGDVMRTTYPDDRRADPSI